MIRYFINYEELLENNFLNEVIDIANPRLNIIKKTKKGLYKFEPLLYVREKSNDLLNYARRINYNKKGILMVELTQEESKLFDDLFIKKYILSNNTEYKKIFDNLDNTIHLINYSALINMNMSEINKGSIVAMMPCVSNKDYMYISGDRSVLLNESISKRRNELKKMNIGCDIYLHTENEEMLDKFKDHVTEVKEIDFHTYKLTKHRFYVIDSLMNNDVIGFNGSNYNCLDILLLNSLPVFISKNEDSYKFSLKEKYDYINKGYIIDDINLYKMIKSSSIDPLIKFINVYEIEDDKYIKTSLNEYIKKEDAKSLIKRNWN